MCSTYKTTSLENLQKLPVKIMGDPGIPWVSREVPWCKLSCQRHLANLQVACRRVWGRVTFWSFHLFEIISTVLEDISQCSNLRRPMLRLPDFPAMANKVTKKKGRLVGGFNPVGKTFYSQIASFPQVGVKIEMFETIQKRASLRYWKVRNKLKQRALVATSFQFVFSMFAL